MIGWTYIGVGILALGLGLFLLVLGLAAKSATLGSILSTPLPTGLDSIPGSSRILSWVGVALLGASLLSFWLGLGLVNLVQAARRTILVFSVLEIGLAFLAWAIIAVVRQGFWDIPIIGAILFWYLTRPRVRKQFEKTPLKH